MERRVARADLDAELKKIERSGTERLVSAVPESEDVYMVKTEVRSEPRMETR